jgi:hypothetical protein
LARQVADGRGVSLRHAHGWFAHDRAEPRLDRCNSGQIL